MGDIRWYKRDPNAALAGFAVLTLEERGAYDTVLDLIYAHDGDLDDDEHFLAGWMRSDVRVWRRLRQRLLDLGKIYIHAGKIRNERCDRELVAAQHRIASASIAGIQSAAKREADRRFYNGLKPTAVERPVQLPTKKESITTTESFAAREKRSAEEEGNGLVSSELANIVRGKWGK